MPGKPVDKIVLAAVRFVGHHHHIAPLAQPGIAPAALFREKLLDGGKDDPARGHGEQLSQILAAGSLHRRLAQKLLAVAKGIEKLLVQIVAIRQHHDGGVAHRLRQHQFPGVEDHRKALPAALRMPHHPGALVALGLALDARQAVDGWMFCHPVRRLDPVRRIHKMLILARRRPQRRSDGFIDRKILVVGGHFFDALPWRAGRLGFLEDDKMPDHIQQRLLIEQSLNQRLQLRLVLRVHDMGAIHAFPFHKAGIIAGDRPRPGKPAVADHQKGVRPEQRGDNLLVGLQLLEGRPHVRLFIRRIFEFDHHQRQPVDKQHDIRALVRVIFHHRVLVNRQEFVVFRPRKIHQPRLIRARLALPRAKLHIHPFRQQAVEGFVVVDRRQRLAAQRFFEGLFTRFGGEMRIEALDRRPQPPLQDHIPIAALRLRPFRQIRAEHNRVAVLVPQHFEGHLFDLGFVKNCHHLPPALRMT